MKKMRMAAGVLAVLLACRAVPFGNAEAAGVEMRNLEILETGQKNPEPEISIEAGI